MSFYKRISLRAKILLPLIPTIFIIFVALGLYASSEIKSALNAETKNQLQVNIRLLSDMITTINTATINNANERSDSLIKLCGGLNGFTLNTQASVKVGDLDTPALSLNGTVQNLNEVKVEEFSNLYSGSVATIFVRKGNDFARITTSLKKEDGSRAIGTLLGEGHPAHKKLMAGEIYHGIARLFGSWYMPNTHRSSRATKSLAPCLSAPTSTRMLTSLSSRFNGSRWAAPATPMCLMVREPC